MSKAMAKFCPHENRHIPSVLDRERVKACVFAGFSQPQIADLMDIHLSTLQRHYSNELKHGYSDAMSAVSHTALKLALEGNDKLIMFILKTKGAGLGWQEKQVIEHGVSKELEALQQQVLDLEKKHEQDY